jgi:hypothetical protein
MRKFTKYPQGYVKASQNWREKTECKSRNGKIVRMQNVSNSFNDQDYYILYDADGNFVEKSLDFNDLHDKLYGVKASNYVNAVLSQGYVKASSDANPYMKDLAEYLDYLSDAEIDDLSVEDRFAAPDAWIEVPEHLHSTVENAVGSDLCSPNESYWFYIEYHPDDDSIFFGIDTDIYVETLNVSKETEDRFKAKFKKELGKSVFSTSTIKASSDNSEYVLTAEGRRKVEQYVRELDAKRKEILDAGKDTIDETPDPVTVDDIVSDLNWGGVDENGEYLNGWYVTDNYDSDYPICLQLGVDFIEK